MGRMTRWVVRRAARRSVIALGRILAGGSDALRLELFGEQQLSAVRDDPIARAEPGSHRDALASFVSGRYIAPRETIGRGAHVSPGLPAIPDHRPLGNHE